LHELIMQRVSYANRCLMITTWTQLLCRYHMCKVGNVRRVIPSMGIKYLRSDRSSGFLSFSSLVNTSKSKHTSIQKPGLPQSTIPQAKMGPCGSCNCCSGGSCGSNCKCSSCGVCFYDLNRPLTKLTCNSTS